MDGTTTDQLAQVQRDVDKVARLIMQQRNMVRSLETAGHAAANAIAMLVQLEDLQALFVAERDDLARAVAAQAGRKI